MSKKAIEDHLKQSLPWTAQTAEAQAKITSIVSVHLTPIQTADRTAHCRRKNSVYFCTIDIEMAGRSKPLSEAELVHGPGDSLPRRNAVLRWYAIVCAARLQE